ncbi:MAG: UDP-N-acetylmuramate:L-alanyl-gamma-D-glutamyl-meso-diaminopimelate ligase [Idiomarina sp.]|nr:UDP-N-acetylmuramate:L-alanyl-gamma-D-glutamyl-meso-diaminopimelate ligase [Idiomarina sp.]
MGGIAAIARQLGYRVTGWDQNVYPPMSTQLEQLGIEVTDSLTLTQLEPCPDLVIVGNAMSRGHALVEAVLERRIPYQSGPQWLGDQVLRKKHVLAVAGTHGKTTTASMLVHILQSAGLAPSFLVGGVVKPYGVTAQLTDSDYMVIEADEYDTAFFDKRSKFVHYHPNTFVINNLEFDHADIFPDLAAIQRQFAHALRLVPASGQVIYPENEPAIDRVLAQGCWSQRVPLNLPNGWRIELYAEDASQFDIYAPSGHVGRVNWALVGKHNAMNALAASAAAMGIGVSAAAVVEALSSFTAPARRMEVRAECAGVTLYDDFAHHPTAVATTLAGLRAKVGSERIIAIFEPRSNTMKAGVHAGKLDAAFVQADAVYALQPTNTEWSLEVEGKHHRSWQVEASVEALVARIAHEENEPSHWVVMSNGGFGGIHEQLLEVLELRAKQSVKEP